MVPVMLGVYLAFALNNFGETRKQKKQTETFKKMLVNEIERNLEEVERVWPYHESLSIDFDTLFNSENFSESFKQYQFRGLRTGLVNNSAYNTGIQTGIIQGLELELIQEINRLYTHQESYDEYNKSVINSFMGRDFPESEDKMIALLRSMDMSLNDILNYEDNLIVNYKEILQILK